MKLNFTHLSFLLLLSFNATYAQWNADTLDRNKLSNNGYNGGVRVISDGQQGFFVSWILGSDVNPYTFMAQHVDSAGNNLWGAGGKTIIPYSALNYVNTDGFAISAGDSSDGYIVWGKHIGGGGSHDNLYVQRFDDNGNPLFGASGIELYDNLATVLLRNVSAIPDDSGGVFLICTYDPFSTPNRIQLQRIDRSGTTHFSTLHFMGPSSGAGLIYALTDAAGGGFYFYGDNTQYLKAEHFDRYGNDTWAVPVEIAIGSSVDSAYAYAAEPAVHGCWYFYQDTANAFLNFLDSSGTKKWSNPGVIVSDTTIGHFQTIPDFSGGAYVCYDGSGYADSVRYIIKHYDVAGNSTITGADTIVRVIPRFVQDMKMTSDGNDGAIVTWKEIRYGRVCIFAQHIDMAGNKFWRASGYPVITANNQPPAGCTSACTIPQVTVNAGSNNTFVAWPDNRTSNSTHFYTIYGAKINGTFASGIPENIFSDDALTIAPNPANDVVSILINDKIIRADDIKFSLSNLLGATVDCSFTTNNSKEIQFDISSLPKGIYVLHLSIGSKNISRKVVKM